VAKLHRKENNCGTDRYHAKSIKQGSGGAGRASPEASTPLGSLAGTGDLQIGSVPPCCGYNVIGTEAGSDEEKVSPGDRELAERRAPP
jgi:hypothetical protein